MDETVAILQDLVRIPSMNPMGRELKGPGYTEGDLAEYVEAFLRRAGADVERADALPGRPNVIARLEHPAPAASLLLEAHMDTVVAENMSIDPFHPVIRDGRLYGRGACDTKGSLAGMMAAMARLARSSQRPHVSVILAATADEEFRFSGIDYALRNGLRADFGVCGEPTELKVVIAHKGVVRWRLRTTGRSTHSSRCDDGVNAIYRMARVVAALERYHRTQLLPSPAHRLVGHPTLSVGRIVGGQTVNTVPDWAQIEVDRRLIPGETAEGARHDLHRYLRSQPEIDGEVRIEDPFMTSSPMETCESAAVVQAARDASMAVLGRAEVAGVPYGSDASEMVAAGIPSVVLGPGNILQAHSAEEYVEVQQVELATRIYEEIVRRLGERRRA